MSRKAIHSQQNAARAIYAPNPVPPASSLTVKLDDAGGTGAIQRLGEHGLETAQLVQFQHFRLIWSPSSSGSSGSIGSVLSLGSLWSLGLQVSSLKSLKSHKYQWSPSSKFGVDLHGLTSMLMFMVHLHCSGSIVRFTPGFHVDIDPEVPRGSVK